VWSVDTAIVVGSGPKARTTNDTGIIKVWGPWLPIFIVIWGPLLFNLLASHEVLYNNNNIYKITAWEEAHKFEA
jgi:hypothetical protein